MTVFRIISKSGVRFVFTREQMKWNESGFRPPLCTYRLNWARRTSCGWWDDTVLQTQDSKFEPWRSEAEHATSRSRRLPAILTFTRGWGRNIFCSFQTAESGNRTPNSGVKGSGANHYPRAPALSESTLKNNKITKTNSVLLYMFPCIIICIRKWIQRKDKENILLTTLSFYEDYASYSHDVISTIFLKIRYMQVPAYRIASYFDKMFSRYQIQKTNQSNQNKIRINQAEKNWNKGSHRYKIR